MLSFRILPTYLFFLRMAYSILFVWGLFRKGTKKAGLVETRPGPKLIVYEKKLNADKDGYQILKQDFDPGGDQSHCQIVACWCKIVLFQQQLLWLFYQRTYFFCERIGWKGKRFITTPIYRRVVINRKYGDTAPGFRPRCYSIAL